MAEYCSHRAEARAERLPEPLLFEALRIAAAAAVLCALLIAGQAFADDGLAAALAQAIG